MATSRGLGREPLARAPLDAAGRGAICFFSYQYPIDSMPLVDRLIREYSTMIVPGIQFRAERHLRIGFGMPSRVLHSGLAAIDRLLTTID